MRSIVLASESFSPPDNYEHALARGSLIVFGESMPEFLATLDAEPEMSRYDGIVVASVRAKDLPLPHDLTVRALLIFAHPMPGAGNRETSKDEMEHWRSRLLRDVQLVEGREHSPSITMSLFGNATDITVVFEWTSAGGTNQRGVSTTQIIRIARALDRAYQLR
jgi:hypothetical protein